MAGRGATHSATSRGISLAVAGVLIALTAALVPRSGANASLAAPSGVPVAWSAAGGLWLRGTVVTMDDDRRVLTDGNVLVRDGLIQAVWSGATPVGVSTLGAEVVDAGPEALIYPGLSNLHNHPAYAAFETWPAPSSHAQPEDGRPTGAEPYTNRSQWRESPDHIRLVAGARTVMINGSGLLLRPEAFKYAETRAILGGETAMQGAQVTPQTDNLLVRNVDNMNFGEDRVEQTVVTVGGPDWDDAAPGYRTRMQDGLLDALFLHLGEGVRDGDRPPGDPISSRAELDELQADGLLTDMTVVIHGTALERTDFASMRAAPTIRTDGTGDGLGAKLVWSPTSNLMLYGRTASVYEAVAEDLTVSLGTDWTPSGGPTLLTEMKVADRVLRDPSLLGGTRDLVPALSATGKSGPELAAAETALDQLLVEMVTTNPARTLRWDDRVGSIEAGKVADLLVITDPATSPTGGMPASPYRSLVDATERDVQLVTVGGVPLAGAPGVMAQLKPGDHEIVASARGGFSKAVDITAFVLEGNQTLTQVRGVLDSGLEALGGDAPPVGGGPSPPTNTWSSLKANVDGGVWAASSDGAFRDGYLLPLFGEVDGLVNVEKQVRAPLLVHDDDWFFAIMAGRVASGGVVDDPSPPYGGYAINTNVDAFAAAPFAPLAFEQRWWFNVAPICTDASVATPEDVGVAITISCTDSGPPRLVLETPPAHGAVTIGSGSTLHYTPAPDFFGADVVVVRATDGELSSAPVTITLTVTPVDDPVASTTTTLSSSTTTFASTTTIEAAAPSVASGAPPAQVSSSSTASRALPATGGSHLPRVVLASVLLVVGAVLVAAGGIASRRASRRPT